MEPITAVILIVSFFLLRFTLPLLCTIGVCRLLNRWQASWTEQPT
jgi:hypothetical protein